MEWIIENKEWLFGGVLVSIPIAIIGWLIFRGGNKQTQKGGKGSTNIQIGGNLHIGESQTDEQTKPERRR